MVTAFASGPGQSYVFSVFIDSILRDTGMSRTELSALYAIGTAVSAAMAFAVSRLVDRYGARLMLAVIAGAFGAACFGMSAVTGSITVLLGFAALRALGQGSLPVTATLVTVQWFVRYRGRAMAIVSLGFAASNALFPPVTRMLIDSFGWRNAYQILGIVIWLLLIPLALFVVRDRPEQMGLLPDGLPPAEPASSGASAAQSNQAKPRVWSSAQFWLLALPMTAGPFVVTALVFHQASIFAEHGLSPEIAASVFIAFAAASAAMTPIIGFVVERVPARLLLYANLALLLGGSLLAMGLSSPLSATIYAILLGSAGGIQSVVGGVIWADAYGRDAVAPAQGAAALVTISASALAPLPLAALQQQFGNYGPGLILMASVPVLCAIILSFARGNKTA